MSYFIIHILNLQNFYTHDWNFIEYGQTEKKRIMRLTLYEVQIKIYICNQ